MTPVSAYGASGMHMPFTRKKANKFSMINLSNLPDLLERHKVVVLDKGIRPKMLIKAHQIIKSQGLQVIDQDSENELYLNNNAHNNR